MFSIGTFRSKQNRLATKIHDALPASKNKQADYFPSLSRDERERTVPGNIVISCDDVRNDLVSRK